MKSDKFNDARNKLQNKTKIILYHIIAPKYDEQIEEIKQSGTFKPSQNALGGQSNGYYFFTNMTAVNNHLNETKQSWKETPNKTAYIAECEVKPDTIKYPEWKLDYEAMQDFMFDLIYDAAHRQTIKHKNITITATDKHSLKIITGNKFKQIRQFNANEHSGIIEKIADHLYQHDNEFQIAYDRLLQDALYKHGNNSELYAIKTQTPQTITKITPIEKTAQNTVPQQNTTSQIDKFRARYNKSKPTPVNIANIIISGQHD